MEVVETMVTVWLSMNNSAGASRGDPRRTAQAEQEGRLKMANWIKTAEGWEPTDERMKQIVFQIRAGRPHKDIANQFGITPTRVSRIRRRLGLSDRRKGPRTKVIHRLQRVLG